ncbi:transcriptional regulator [Labilibaculum manganireducens]|uniref:Transcriptional regulator n=2 Tax=Labilibaculum manganireducens TaxID=1940525 RepID=A0A2N3IDY4_9BACT|nr:transcriptional regulator [Labilibaculum manganireducens]
MDSIGDIIRKKREEKGMLLRQLAAMVEVDSAILSKIERGERKARREQIINIAKALELDEKRMLIEFLSENIAYEIIDEDSATDVLRVAESKVKYFRKNK